MKDLTEALEGKYREAEALEHYRSYLSNRDPARLLLAFEATAPLIRSMYNIKYRSLNGRYFYADQQDMEAEALTSTYWVLEKGKVPLQQGGFTKWLALQIKRRMVDALRTMNHGREPQTGDPSIWSNANDHSFREIELRDLNTELPGIVEREIRRHIRFRDPMQLRAAEYVVSSLYECRPPNPRILVNYYQIEDPQFWVEYILVLVRNALYRLKGLFRESIYGEQPVLVVEHPNGEPLEE